MIVTCPACSSRYQFDEERLEGRSAKITCPGCAHVYVVHPPRVEPAMLADTWPSEAMDEQQAASVLAEEPPVPVDIDTADFTAHGVIWKVRQGLGLIHDFRTLAELREALDDGLIDKRDGLSYDGHHFVPIDGIDDLESHFTDVWERALRGEIRTHEDHAFVIGADADDADADAPTTIVRTGSAFSLDLDAPLDEEIGNAPPPAAPLDVGGGEVTDAPTEDADRTADAGRSSAAVPPTPPKPNLAPTAAQGSSRLPLVLLIAVVLAVLALVLYKQGVFAGLAG